MNASQFGVKRSRFRSWWNNVCWNHHCTGGGKQHSTFRVEFDFLFSYIITVIVSKKTIGFMMRFCSDAGRHLSMCLCSETALIWTKHGRWIRDQKEWSCEIFSGVTSVISGKGPKIYFFVGIRCIVLVAFPSLFCTSLGRNTLIRVWKSHVEAKFWIFLAKALLFSKKQQKQGSFKYPSYMNTKSRDTFFGRLDSFLLVEDMSRRYLISWPFYGSVPFLSCWPQKKYPILEPCAIVRPQTRPSIHETWLIVEIENK